MRPLSAIDAIGPAWNHTRRLLLGPGRPGLLLKIGLVAVFAQVGGLSTSSFNHQRHIHDWGNHPHLTAEMAPFLAAIAALAVVLIGVFFLLALAFFYLGSRLQFVLFEVVLRSDTTVGPIWRRYGAATWRWMGLRLLFVLAALLCIAPVVAPAALNFFHHLPHPGMPPADVANFITNLLSLFATIFLVALIFGTIKILLHDFGLPSMALESTPMGVTVERVVRLFRAEPGQVLLYLVMRFVMHIAGSIACSLLLGLGAFVALIPLGGAGAVLWFTLRHADVAGHVVMVMGFVVLGILFLGLMIAAGIMLIGYLIAFLQAYAIYFLGGRYPLVGAYIEPFLMPPAYTYAQVAPTFTPPPAPIEGEP